MLLKLAWRNLWRNKRRTLITMASVLFAALLAIFMMGLKEGSYSNMIENIAGVYTGYMQVHKEGYWAEQTLNNSLEFTDSLKEILLEEPRLKGYAPRVESFVLTSSREFTKGAMIVGTDPEMEDQLIGLKKKLIAGSYFHEDERSVLMGEGLADYLKLTTGDTLVIIGQGYRGINAVAKYPIKGLLKFGSPELTKTLVYLPLKEAQWLFGLESRLTSIVLLPEDPGNTERISRRLKKRISGDYEVMTWKELLPELDQMIESDRAEGYIFMGILYVIISFGIFGTVLMMLAERKHEFGVLVAIGMKRLKLSFMVFMEVVIISILGAMAGMVASFPLVLWFKLNPIRFGDELNEIYEEFGFEPIFTTSTDPAIFLTQSVIVFILASVISIYVFINLSGMKAIDAMRS